MHLPAKVNSLSVQTFMAIKTLSDSYTDGTNPRVWLKINPDENLSIS